MIRAYYPVKFLGNRWENTETVTWRMEKKKTHNQWISKCQDKRQRWGKTENKLTSRMSNIIVATHSLSLPQLLVMRPLNLMWPTERSTEMTQTCRRSQAALRLKKRNSTVQNSACTWAFHGAPARKQTSAHSCQTQSHKHTHIQLRSFLGSEDATSRDHVIKNTQARETNIASRWQIGRNNRLLYCHLDSFLHSTLHFNK